MKEVLIDFKPKPIQVRELSATGRGISDRRDVLSLNGEDDADPAVSVRFLAKKSLRLHGLPDDKDSAKSGAKANLGARTCELCIQDTGLCSKNTKRFNRLLERYSKGLGEDPMPWSPF